MLEAHAIALSKGGGLDGLRDVSSIQSAIGRPYTGYYPRAYQKAAALAESMARNHGFIDGNKRTAYIVVDLFVGRSGYALHSVTGDPYIELEELVLRIADEHPPMPELVAWFKARMRKS